MILPQLFSIEVDNRCLSSGGSHPVPSSPELSVNMMVPFQSRFTSSLMSKSIT